MVGVAVPDEVVKAQREALAAREVRMGRAVEMLLSIDEAGRFLSERGTEVILGLVDTSWGRKRGEMGERE
jgi:hypothetical protein